MNDTVNIGLLPQGLRDLLPPQAEAEAALVERLMATLASHGYERVEPPLVEFEDTLLAGAGASMAKETFRLMDPVSQRMIGMRADMTPQVARIAATRLAVAPRPLRLSYAGQVLRVKGGHLNPERQLGQVGAELIGSDDVAADIEVLAVAAEALEAVGMKKLSVDLTLPPLVPMVCSALGLDAERADRVRAALDHKDAAAVAAVGGKAGTLLGKLLAAAGTADKTLKTLGALKLPEEAAAELTRLATVCKEVTARVPALAMTIDPVENRGFEYHTGISFAFFASGVRGELGRGGRYRTGNGGGEPATGFTIYTDLVVEALPDAAPARRLFVPAGADPALVRKLRGEGWITVAALGSGGEKAEAKRLGCTHWLTGGKAVAVP
ncbi:MAG TPA: ATP phosphoribosyltransferase regulatory subunit [Stellaceae bacterium]|nr:ATP phosphoribosyltransferase regulatory subunit [Stellaceae bacterium]